MLGQVMVHEKPSGKWEREPHPVETWIPKCSHGLFVVTGLMRNGLGCRSLPSIYQDFVFLPGGGHAGPTLSKSCPCVISQIMISVDFVIHIARLLPIQHRLNKQCKNIFNEILSFCRAIYLPALTVTPIYIDTDSKFTGVYCLKVSNYYW